MTIVWAMQTPPCSKAVFTSAQVVPRSMLQGIWIIRVRRELTLATHPGHDVVVNGLTHKPPAPCYKSGRSASTDGRLRSGATRTSSPENGNRRAFRSRGRGPLAP